MAKKLTIERLRTLRFKRDLFLNLEGYHANSASNKEFDLLISTKSEKRTYKIVERTLTAANGAEADLLADDIDSELERFIEAYNA